MTEHNAKSVAALFAKVYFSSLHSKPEELYRFYADNAVLTVSGGDASDLEVSGAEAIRKRFDDMNLKELDCRTVVDTLQAQTTNANGDLTILLTATLHVSASVARHRFSRAFVLKKVDSAFVITNDLLIFADSAPAAFGGSSSSSSPVLSTVAHSVAEKEKKDTPAASVATVPVSHPAKEVASVVAAPATKETHVPAPAASQKAEGQQPKQAKREPKKDASSQPRKEEKEQKPDAPKSYAAMISASSKSSGMTSTTVTAPAPQKIESSKAPVAAAVAPPTSSASHGEEKTHKPKRSADATIYVRFAADPSVTETVLREVFGQFGTIVGMMLAALKGYGFVDFDSSEAAQRAVSSNGLTVAGHPVEVALKGRGPEGNAKGPRPAGTAGSVSQNGRIPRKEHQNGDGEQSQRRPRELQNRKPKEQLQQ
eukprot:ANDGO_04479.mRNA.1 nuclear transport factor 2 (NTF2) family protein / RNA recognition motif (RRM)-containing protein